MILKRDSYLASGIFGVLQNDMNDFLCETLEHAFPNDAQNGWLPIIPPGVYTCVRGMHHLKNKIDMFETFEITGVAGHTGLLFHPGNINADSHGCVLVGTDRQMSTIINSRVAFQALMNRLTGLDSFKLTVE